MSINDIFHWIGYHISSAWNYPIDWSGAFTVLIIVGLCELIYCGYYWLAERWTAVKDWRVVDTQGNVHQGSQDT